MAKSQQSNGLRDSRIQSIKPRAPAKVHDKENMNYATQKPQKKFESGATSARESYGH